MMVPSEESQVPTSVDTISTVYGVVMQRECAASFSLRYTEWRTAAVCWRVLQHRSVVKLIVLHRVVGEQAPAHTQGRLGGRVGHLGVDYRGRRRCFYIRETLGTVIKSNQDNGT